ncbi:MAG: DUF1931 domain-containing protein [Nanoarchaeota archaeon]|nr:DUF1931 domain-containing protein [Nanoarchaeota archaeon]
MAEMLVVGSKVRAVVKKNKMNMSGDFLKALSKEVEALVKKAVTRAKANKRKTLRPADL